MTINGRFDGQRVVLDEPVPTDIPPNTRVRVLFETNGAEKSGDAGAVLDSIARLAVDDDLPADFAAQHEHYVKGAPKR